MDRLQNSRRSETEPNALTRRLVERSGLDHQAASQAVDDYLHAENSMVSSEPMKRRGKVDLSGAN